MAQTRAIFISTLLHLSVPLILIFLLFPHQIHTQPATTAPPPSSSTTWPVDIIDILKTGKQFNIFVKFLDTANHLGKQIDTQIITSTDGVSVLAAPDSAFTSLPSGTLNKLSDQQKVRLIQFHILPKFYSLDDLETASNPVETLAGGEFVLNFTGSNGQVNVTSGVVQTQVSNIMRKNFPLAVYQIDKVLLPLEFTSKARPTLGNKGRPNKTAAAAPKNSKEHSPADEPSPAANGEPNSAGRMSQFGLGLAPAAVVLFCMGVF
ncbi:PREDICTED: fasciclin-like arabinogalactan protein 6 [Ipomoea nil]|uniref:fasciclin-like arabinogalactan protein 6 n=1 Tax=Ipomoea nil TaxID=35883 RepID=UPI000900EA18|nr:PREDICTED: fasciclin-like arabinogalactan protein 6 [Ipomoea nil]